LNANNVKPIKRIEQPLIFEQNQGQFDSKIKYLSRGNGYNITLGASPVVELFKYKSVESKKANSHDLDVYENNLNLIDHTIFQIQILDSNNNAKVIAEDNVVTKTNYISGQKDTWKTNIPNFKSIRYQEILKNIDVTYYGNNGRLEYDFIVKPKANVNDIKVKFNGVDSLKINNKGQLVLEVGQDHILQNNPIAYQVDTNGLRREVEAKYQLKNNQVQFEVGQYDTSIDLIIDPVLEYSRYYGGSKNEFVTAIDVDNSDNIYMVGHSASPNLATSGAYQELNNSPKREESVSYQSCFDCTDSPPNSAQTERFHILPPSTSSVFVTKLSPDGTTVLWTTYFSHPDALALTLGINSAAVSAIGEVAFGLTSNAPDGLPLINTTQTYSQTQPNVYIAKLNSNGDGIIFSTYLNIGSNTSILGLNGWLRGLDVSTDGSVAVTGYLTEINNGETDFPEINPIAGQDCSIDPSTFQDLTDGWVILFNSTGTVTFSSCLGGSTRSGSILEALRGVSIGPNGHLYVVGYTSMTDFPLVNPVQNTLSFSDYRDITITQINPTNSEIVFSTYLGPIKRGISATPSSNQSIQNFPIDIKVDTNGNIFVSGSTNLTGWPSVNAFQPNIGLIDNVNSINASNGNFNTLGIDSYLTKINPSTAEIIFSTYIGGEINENYWNSLTVDADGNSYLLALTDSDDYPVTNSIQAIKFGRTSSAVSKFSPQGALIYSSYHGGTDDINATSFYPGGIVVNSSNKLIVATNTEADDFNVVGSTSTRSGGFDATLAIIDQSIDIDSDGDGVVDGIDVYPSDSNEWLNSDLDGIGDNSDTDDDNDSVLDIDDVYPLDPTETLDSDGDGMGDNADLFPNDPLNTIDADLNGEGDFTESDPDKDGFSGDFRPFDATEWFDSDNDGVGNNSDLDDDDDGFEDLNDAAPLNPDYPIITFNAFNSQNSGVYKSPLPNGFTHLLGTDVEWTSATDQSFSGSTSLSTISPDDNQMAGVQYEEIFEAGTLSFNYKIDSEQGFDFFTFSLDGQVLLIDSGNVDWTLFTTPITSGNHILVWKYIKNGSISAKTDAVWIDDLAGFPQADTDLVVTVTQSELTISDELPLSVSYTFEVYNNSISPATRVNFQSLIPVELTNVIWTCSVLSSLSTCNSE
jgi:hypothetical protein